MVLEPYFVADPLLLCDFVYFCPEDDYPELFKRVPTHLSLAWLSSHQPLPFLHKDVSSLADVNFSLCCILFLKGGKMENVASRDQEEG